VIGFDVAIAVSRLAKDVVAGQDGRFRLRMLGDHNLKVRSDGFVRKPEWSSWPGCPDILIAPRGDEAVAISFASQSENASTRLPGGKRISAVSWDPRGGQWRGALIQLTQVVDALRGTKHTLEAACHLYGVPLRWPVASDRLSDEVLDHCRRTVRAMAELYAAIKRDLALHADANVEPQNIYSGASFARGYWKASGVERAPKISPRLAALGAACFSGARVEARIVRCSVPIIVGDRSAAYLRDAVTLGTEELLSAAGSGRSPPSENSSDSSSRVISLHGQQTLPCAAGSGASSCRSDPEASLGMSGRGSRTARPRVLSQRRSSSTAPGGSRRSRSSPPCSTQGTARRFTASSSSCQTASSRAAPFTLPVAVRCTATSSSGCCAVRSSWTEITTRRVPSA
jgi:hypothetical protein